MMSFNYVLIKVFKFHPFIFYQVSKVIYSELKTSIVKMFSDDFSLYYSTQTLVYNSKPKRLSKPKVNKPSDQDLMPAKLTPKRSK